MNEILFGFCLGVLLFFVVPLALFVVAQVARFFVG